MRYVHVKQCCRFYSWISSVDVLLQNAKEVKLQKEEVVPGGRPPRAASYWEGAPLGHAPCHALLVGGLDENDPVGVR